uniref:Uncharacterized protein n=1 Tax=Octopus bimaculoides TaxID=37653 RepID=A0A0L8H305_OCTBM
MKRRKKKIGSRTKEKTKMRSTDTKKNIRKEIQENLKKVKQTKKRKKNTETRREKGKKYEKKRKSKYFIRIYGKKTIGHDVTIQWDQTHNFIISKRAFKLVGHICVLAVQCKEDRTNRGLENMSG